MGAKAKFQQFVAQKGLRQTDQRLKIFDVFWATERHLSVQELFDLVRKKHKNIGYATVARTMKLFADSGICTQVDFGDGISRYEHKFGHEHHDHLICVKCDRFVEIHSDKLEKLQTQLVKKHGFIQENHKLEIFGICPKCKNKKSKSKGSNTRSKKSVSAQKK